MMISPFEWHHIYRSLLRECSYLPDPIAKTYMRGYVAERFRRRTDESYKNKNDPIWQTKRRKAAAQGLTLLTRANEGYTKPLEKVLRLSYGRQGRRRRFLVEQLVEPEVPADNLVITDFITQPRKYHDGWKPPSLVVDLMKAQSSHYPIHRLRARPHIRNFEPPIPKANSYGRPVVFSRRKNIRRKWYVNALGSLYPPLPDGELSILEGLISGDLAWKPVRKRTPVGSAEPSATSLAMFLAEGPEKGHTFEKYVDGRPHILTRRLMRHLWQRISTLVPRVGWDATKQQRRITWDSLKAPMGVSLEVDDTSDLFEGIRNDGETDGGQTASENRDSFA